MKETGLQILSPKRFRFLGFYGLDPLDTNHCIMWLKASECGIKGTLFPNDIRDIIS